jgi:hypothetical protein
LLPLGSFHTLPQRSHGSVCSAREGLCPGFLQLYANKNSMIVKRLERIVRLIVQEKKWLLQLNANFKTLHNCVKKNDFVIYKTKTG